ncbi:MAG: NYN domain-containing protein [SAR202 cluster bacterium]|nr:NYN domain-containing protein [SAR202 cluster bacterium]
MTTTNTRSDQQIALLIDFENVGLEALRWLFDQIYDQGRVIVRRAYGDWTTAASKREDLLELGIEPIQLLHSSRSGKNASDIRLSIDAIDLLYQSPVDAFVIVSSDSDFVPLVNRLRSAGKTVIGAGRKSATSPILVRSYDIFHDLELAESPRRAPRPAPTSKAGDLLVRAVEASVDGEGRVSGSRLIQTIQRLDPSFSYKALGFSTFRKFLESSPEVRVSMPREPGVGDVFVELSGQDGSQQQPQRPRRGIVRRRRPSGPPPSI